MLKHLHVTNFVLIKSVDVELDDKMSAFTGETGAGKSLLIDALNALLGQRITDEVVGNHGDSARIEGIFSFTPDEKAYQLLLELGIDADDDVIFSREIARAGKNTCKINLRTVNLSILKEILSSAVDIHSQHETQYLLNNKMHLHLLDKYVNDFSLMKQMKDAFTAYQAFSRKQELLLSEEFDEEFIKKLKDDVRIIEEFNPSQSDYEACEAKSKEMNAYENLYETVTGILKRLNSDNGILESLYISVKDLNQIREFQTLDTVAGQFEDAYYQIEDVQVQLADYLSQLEFDEGEFERVQQRLFDYTKLRKRYGYDIQDILDEKERMLERINQFENLEYELMQINKEIDRTLTHALAIADTLHGKREGEASVMTAMVIKHLTDLSLEHAQFEVQFEKGELSSTGYDTVQFLISMNPGEALKPLASVASGGELSRLMLGLKIVFNRVYGITTTVFDEIDSGVSGKVAFRIGMKMSELAQQMQVLTVTHLAPVAACADQQYLIQKSMNDDSTITSIHKLNRDKRIEELALIANGQINRASIDAATTLLEQGQSIHE